MPRARSKRTATTATRTPRVSVTIGCLAADNVPLAEAAAVAAQLVPVWAAIRAAHADLRERVDHVGGDRLHVPDGGAFDGRGIGFTARGRSP